MVAINFERKHFEEAEAVYSGLYCCHGNGNDVKSNIKMFPRNKFQMLLPMISYKKNHHFS